MNCLNSKITKLLDNVEFDKKLVFLETKPQIKEHFKDYDVEITDEELNKVFNLMENLRFKFEKLSDDQLKDIGGGGFEAVAAVLSSVTSCITGVSKDIKETTLTSTKMKCESNEKIAKIEADSKLNKAKYLAADHVVGYVLASALALYYIKKRTNLESKKYLK